MYREDIKGLRLRSPSSSVVCTKHIPLLPFLVLRSIQSAGIDSPSKIYRISPTSTSARVISSIVPFAVRRLHGILFTALSARHLIISTTSSFMMPRATTNARGIIVASGLLVEIAGIDYNIALKT